MVSSAWWKSKRRICRSETGLHSVRSKTEIGFKGMGFHPRGEISPSWFADSAKGILFIVLAAIGSSAKSIFVRLAYLQQVDAATLLTLRMGISLPLVMLIWGFEDKDTECYKLRITDGSADVVLGLLGYYLANMLDFWGLEFISAGLERLIVFLYPTLVTIFSCIYFGRIMQKMELVALGTCYL